MPIRDRFDDLRCKSMSKPAPEAANATRSVKRLIPWGYGNQPRGRTRAVPCQPAFNSIPTLPLWQDAQPEGSSGPGSAGSISMRSLRRGMGR